MLVVFLRLLALLSCTRLFVGVADLLSQLEALARLALLKRLFDAKVAKEQVALRSEVDLSAPESLHCVERLIFGVVQRILGPLQRMSDFLDQRLILSVVRFVKTFLFLLLPHKRLQVLSQSLLEIDWTCAQVEKGRFCIVRLLRRQIGHLVDRRKAAHDSFAAAEFLHQLCLIDLLLLRQDLVEVGQPLVLVF